MNIKKISLLILSLIVTLMVVACTPNTVQTFKVTFDFNNDSDDLIIEVVESGLIELPSEPTKSGFTFGGWFKDAQFSQAWMFESDKVTSDMRLYAKWNPEVPQFYTITYDTDGGSSLLNMSAQPGSSLIDFTSATPIKEGYNFVGWFKNTDKTEPVLSTDLVTSHITLYAKWAIILVYFEVNFDSNGGSEVETASILKDSLLTSPLTIRVGNYAFDGWYKEEAFETKWNFETDVVTNDMTLYAKWLNIYTVTLNTTGGSQIDSQMIVHGEKALLPDEPTKPGFSFVGWSKNQATNDPYDFDTPVTGLLTLYAVWEIGAAIEISTKEALLNLFNNPDGGNYKLTADIDFEHIPYAVSSATRTFSGILDGNGHKIKNISASSAANKQGVFFKILTGTIKNLTIENSFYQGGGEASGFLVAHIHGGAVVDTVEFVNVGVLNSGNYTALIAGDDANNSRIDLPITISNIIVRNYGETKIKGNEHSGGLIGYLRNANVTLNVNNVYFEGTVESTGATASFILGRLGTSPIHVNVNQAVLKGKLKATKQTGAILGQGIAGSFITVQKAFLSNALFTTSETTNNSFVGNNLGTIALTYAYYVTDNTQFFRDYEGGINLVASQGEAKLGVDITQAWFNLVAFNSLFKYQDNDLKLNKEIILEPTSLVLDTNSMKPFYIEGDALDLELLKVKLLYSDGSMVDILLTDQKLEIDSTVVDMNASGSYEVTIRYETFERILLIRVVSISSIYIYETDFVDLYLKNTQLDTSDIYVLAELSDLSVMKINQDDLELISNYDSNTAGNYSVKFKYLSFETQSLVVTVIDQVLEPVGNTVTVHVDQSVLEDSYLGNNLTFRSVRKALLALKKSSLGTVEKIIYVADGSYYEKLTIDLPNLRIIGESMSETIIYYDQASGNQKPVGGTWGTQGSASVSVKGQATNFMMSNLSVKNTFPYYTSTLIDKQAVALVNEADQAIYYKVGFYGVQDTLYAKQGRQWYKEVYVEGAVDYIFGNGGPVYIESSTIHTLYRSNADAVITAFKGYNGSSPLEGMLNYGVLLYNNTLTADQGVPERKVFFGRPWAKEALVAFIENKVMFNHLDSNHWTEMSGNLPENAAFYEYQNINQDLAVIPYALLNKADVLTLEQRNLWVDKSVFFASVNGTTNFNSTWDYAASMDHLVSLTVL